MIALGLLIVTAYCIYSAVRGYDDYHKLLAEANQILPEWLVRVFFVVTAIIALAGGVHHLS